MRRALALAFAVSACDLRAPHETEDPAALRKIAELTASVTARPDDRAARAELARLHLEARHWFAAAELYKQLTELDPSDGEALAGLADAYEKLALYGPAFDALSRGMRAPRGAEECMIRLATMLRSDGTPESLAQARVVYERFLEAAPAHPRAAEARTALRQVEVQLSTTPGGSAARASTSTAAPAAIPEHGGVKPGDPVGALNPFGQAIGRALEAVKANDPAGAERAIREALGYQPDDVSALAFLAEATLAQNKVEEARAAANRAYELAPKDSQARWAFGLVHIRTKGDLGRALEAWRALAKDDPDFARDAGVTQALQEVERMQPK